uniref:RNA-directed DNA polymerase n=1 Tax=Trichogramma kaykai TaxID=54128 RepID=A0ABD2WA60_9HYME
MVGKENRLFANLRVKGAVYKALLDSGAQCCIAGPRLMEELKPRLEDSRAVIKFANQELVAAKKRVKVQMDVDNRIGDLWFECIEALPVEVVLGADFAQRWRIDLSMGGKKWRSFEGPWHSLADTSDDIEACDMVAECGGISVIKDGERELIEKLASELLPEMPDEFGHTDMIKHVIIPTSSKPVYHRARRMSPPMKQVALDSVKDMYAKKIIEPASSNWNSAPVIVKKPDGSYRFCVDYRDLNKVTEKDGYPSRNMDSILDKLRGAKYISKIDLKSAYHQILMDEDSRKYTAFSIPEGGQWQFLRMPFGLINAPMTFQRLMDSLFGTEVEPHVFAYLDDIIVVTETFSEHIRWLKYVIKVLMKAKLIVNKKKCEFCCSRVTFLGYVLDNEGLRIDPERIKPILEYPVPTNVKGVRRLLGMLGWYSRFIKKEAEMNVPLAKLLHKDEKFVWGLEQEEALKKIKVALTNAPVLARPDFSRKFVVQTDASDFALGAVLTQDFEDGEHPIMYISRLMSKAERNYGITEKECLAILWAIDKFRPYLEGYHFTVITDHKALTWLRNFKNPTGRVARWAIKMMEWDFDIVHRKGADHHVPDALSRGFELDRTYDVSLFESIKDERYLQKLKEIEKAPQKFPDWCIEGGLLYRKRRDWLLDPITNSEDVWKLVVPEEYRDRVLSDAHCITSAGHLGSKKTYDRVVQEYYWPGMFHDVEDFVRQCEICQRYKVSQTGPQGLMTRRVVDRPWAVVAADLMEFPRSKFQNKYLLVFQDIFTRWIEVYPLRAATGANVLKAFEQLILFRWETPDFLLTDNGKEFDNKLLNDGLQEYGVKHVYTPPYWPQANPVERSNRTLKTMIASYVGADHQNWDKHLHEFRHAVNTAVQSTLKVSPAFLNMGRQPRLVKSLRKEVEPVDWKKWSDPA